MHFALSFELVEGAGHLRSVHEAVGIVQQDNVHISGLQPGKEPTQLTGQVIVRSVDGVGEDDIHLGDDGELLSQARS